MKVNHPLHIVLAILTGGFWLIPYAVILWNAGRNRKPTQVLRLPTLRPVSADQRALAQEMAGPEYQQWLRERADAKRRRLSD